jgi:light-regulated signal transduction histidine kinase (bacteriophytochrome)
LERANQELQEFAYVASHDLQEPLRTIAGQLQLIQELYGDQLEPRMEKSINFAVDASKRMRMLISDLLAYSRVETQGQPPEPADSEEALSIVLTNLGVAISEAQAEITYDALPVILADPRQLVQLFQNLLENAIKFRGDAPPRVHVSAQRDEQEWIFSVADNGLGIDPKHSDRIFAIFKRLHGVGKYEGSGIGLAICKKIVERQNGRIWVESRPGEGTTFYFTLRDGGEQDDGEVGCATDRDPAGGRQPERCGPDGDGAHEGQGAE